MVGETRAPVVGVVKDFYDQSFHSDINPICILPLYKNFTNCAININLKDAKSTLASFEKIWNETIRSIYILTSFWMSEYSNFIL